MVEVELLDISKLCGNIIDCLDRFVVEVNWLKFILLRVLPPVLLQSMAQHKFY